MQSTRKSRRGSTRTIRKKQSDGSTGEKAAEYLFKALGWRMFRTQPATRVVYAGGKPTVINCGTGGIADYTGYRTKACGCGDLYELYVACEVKEAHGDSMPASRLSRRQRDWMDRLPQGHAWVCVVWDDDVELFNYTPSGSYRRRNGRCSLHELRTR